MTERVHVVGLDDFNRMTLSAVPGCEQYEFHGVLEPAAVRRADTFDFDGLLADAIEQLETSDGPIDAIVTWWDFPSTCLVALLCERFGTRGASLDSVLRLGHKYWSRREQQRVVPQVVPAFRAFDPYRVQGHRDIGLGVPYWVKPVKSVASYLAFEIREEAMLAPALDAIRRGVGRFGDPFEQAMAHARDVPAEVLRFGGHSCLAEGAIGGHQCTLEGYVQNGEPHVYGVVDSLHAPEGHSFSAYVYPSRLPAGVVDRMVAATDRFLRAIDYDEACFNVEFFYDAEADHVWLLEVNSRLSQSHADLFAKVDGAPHFQVMLDVALGRTPRLLRGQGEFACAAKFFVRAYEDGVVNRVPSPEQVRAVTERVPGTRVHVAVQEGQRLSELHDQDSYSYELATIFVGADDHDQLERRFAEVRDALPFGLDLVRTS